MMRALEERGFNKLALWSRGVNTELFRPGPKSFLDLPGTRLVVGDGSGIADCRRRHPQAVYAGFRHGEELAAHVAASDVFVFPSRTDTFGLALLEAMACGLPVAAAGT